MQRRVGWGLVCLALVAAGCSPEAADASDPTSTLEAPTTTAEPTQTSPSTTAVTTTSAVPSTTIAPPTTITPDATTTIDPSVVELVAEAELILERTEGSWEVVLTVFSDPADVQAEAALAEYFTGNQLTLFMAILENYRSGEYRIIERPEVEVYEADPLTLSFDLDRGVATVQVCQVRSSLVVSSERGPDDTEEVIRDEVTDQIIEVQLERSDGVWLVADAVTPDEQLARCEQ